MACWSAAALTVCWLACSLFCACARACMTKGGAASTLITTKEVDAYRDARILFPPGLRTVPNAAAGKRLITTRTRSASQDRFERSRAAHATRTTKRELQGRFANRPYQE